MLALLVGAHTTSSAKHCLKNMLRPAHLRGEVTPLMTAEDRGRLPDHVAQPLVAALAGAMKRERRAKRAGAHKRAARFAGSRKQVTAHMTK